MAVEDQGLVFSTKTRWIVKQGCFTADMTIKDQFDQKAFTAENKIMSWGWTLNLYKIGESSSCGQVKEKVKCFGMPTFTIFIRGKDYGTVEKEFTCCNPKFEISSKKGSMTIEGDWLSFEYTFLRGGRIVAQIDKKLGGFTDCYSVEIQPGENVLFILACCVVIDKVQTQN